MGFKRWRIAGGGQLPMGFLRWKIAPYGLLGTDDSSLCASKDD